MPLRIRVFAVLCAAFAYPALAEGVLPAPGELRPLTTADAAQGWEAVGRLDTGVSFCSATLIAPDLVLTAAHCLFDEDGERIKDSDLMFSASLRNGHAAAYRGISRSFIADGYERIEGRPGMDMLERDLALLDLARPVQEPGIRPIPTGDRGHVRELMTVVSYGRDREDYASIEEDCRILARERAVHVLSCSVVEGSSGAPILRETGVGPEVTAVVSAIGDWDGEAATIAVSVHRLLPDLMAQYTASQTSLFGHTPGEIRRLTSGNSGREGIGARFIRP